jgi:hypothetical protein
VGAPRVPDGKRFPYVWVPEWHPKGHGLHVHFAVGRFIAQPMIASAWQLGFVHIKRRAKGSQRGTLESARQTANYLAAYVGKHLGEGVTCALHRYEVGQGYQPAAVRIVARTREDAIAQASQLMGREPARRWVSQGVHGWVGPPALWVAWDD